MFALVCQWFICQFPQVNELTRPVVKFFGASSGTGEPRREVRGVAKGCVESNGVCVSVKGNHILLHAFTILYN